MSKLQLSKIQQIFGLDLRSLAVFRMGIALIVIEDLISRFRALEGHYSDVGILPRTALQEVLKPWYWSLHILSGTSLWQGFLLAIALILAVALLVGYRTRFVTIATWALLISIHNRNPLLIFAGDHVLRAMLFWAIFLPLGAYYSVDKALNSSDKPLPKWLCNTATAAFILQLCYIYIWSAAFKTKSPMWWPNGEAVYYALNYQQYGTAFGQLLGSFPLPILKLLTYAALAFEWFGALLLFIPFANTFLRILAIISFILLHIGFGLSFSIGTFSILSIFNWLALTPSLIWDKLTDKFNTPERQGLTIYYDADCGFCKKVVHLIRTFLILPHTPLIKAQEEPEIYAAMQEHNSWVVRDYTGKHHYKFSGIIYVCSLSPLLGWLVPLLRLKPIHNLGTKFYETIASNRKTAGLLTRYLKFRPLEVEQPRWLNFVVPFLFILTTIWNLKGFVDQTVARRREQPKDWYSQTHKLLNRKTFQQIAWLPEATRLDQSWSIFAPDVPKDDGWFVIIGKRKDGQEVNAFREGRPLKWEKPTLAERDDFYQTIQWRFYFLSLNRSFGVDLPPYLVKYICRHWNSKHAGNQQLERVSIYFMDERTVPPGEQQPVEKKLVIDQDCKF
jgi:predicted DCC family thiol-disulfide oxidoreductase YuxK